MLLDVPFAFFVVALLVLAGITHTAKVFFDHAIEKAQQRHAVQADGDNDESELCARGF